MIRNGFYNLAGVLIRIASGVIAIPLLIRALGIESYGAWVGLSSIIGLVGLVEGGFSVSTTVFVSQDLANDDAGAIWKTLATVGAAIIFLATLAAITLWWGADIVVEVMPAIAGAQGSAFTQALQVGAIVTWARLIQQVCVGIQQAYQRYATLSVLSASQAILTNVGLLAIAWTGGSIVYMMYWQAVLEAILLFVYIFASWQLVPVRGSHALWDSAHGLRIIRYSSGIWVGTISVVLFSQCDRLIVGSVLGGGALGIYGAITSVVALISTFSATPVQPLLPALSRRTSETTPSNTGPVMDQIRRGIEVNVLGALGIGIAFFALAPDVVALLLNGPPTRENILVMRVLVLTYAVFSTNAVGFFVMLAYKQAVQCMLLQLISATVSLTLIFVLSRHFGLPGAAFGNIGSVVTLMFIVYGARLLNIPLRQWLAWIATPVSWFVVSIIVVLLVENTYLVTHDLFIPMFRMVIVVAWLFFIVIRLIRVVRSSGYGIADA